MRAAIIVTTKGKKSESIFFEQASEGKKAFRSLKGDFDTARYWELSRPQKRIKTKPKSVKPTEVRPFKEPKPEEPTPKNKAAKKAVKS